MNATIDEKGCLIITPGSELESYALNRWSSNYMKGDSESVMLIQGFSDDIGQIVELAPDPLWEDKEYIDSLCEAIEKRVKEKELNLT